MTPPPLSLAAAMLALSPGMALAAAPANGAGLERAQEQLRKADKNGDGAISRNEFIQNRVDQWSRMDRNGDGYFSKDDLPRMARSRWDGDRLAELRRAFDANGDGRIARAEFVNGPTLIFDAADRNQDNIVSKAELQALAQHAQAR